MNLGDTLWIQEDASGPWLEATYEFQCIASRQPLGHHSVMLKDGGGRRVVCDCKTSTRPPDPSAAFDPHPVVNVTPVHRELAYRKLNSGPLPGTDDHEGLAWIALGTDGGPPSFHQESVLAYGIAWGEARASLRKVDP